MASNSFGNIFRITTWGESHGPAIGVVIDGCPAGLPLAEADIQSDLTRRAPAGDNPYTTPRKEADKAVIYSGIFEGKTTGAPISIIIKNTNQDSSQYDSIKNVLRPGHANFTYLEKYGCFDYRGGGRASARETACRVAAGAVAKKLLAYFGLSVFSYLQTLGPVTASTLPEKIDSDLLSALRCARDASPVFCPFSEDALLMMRALDEAKAAQDSLGGIVAATAIGLPIGLGDPVYEKLEANLAKAMMSLPATKAFEIGAGFASSAMQGSAHNDDFTLLGGKAVPASNTAGGTLGGISTGEPLLMRVAFKPTSSIAKAQKSVDLMGEERVFQLPKNARHDPCVAIRAVPVVEAMLALVLADALLLNRCAQLEWQV